MQWILGEQSVKKDRNLTLVEKMSLRDREWVLPLSIVWPIRLKENSVILKGKQKQEFLSNLIGQNIESGSTHSRSRRDIFSTFMNTYELSLFQISNSNPSIWLSNTWVGFWYFFLVFGDPLFDHLSASISGMLELFFSFPFVFRSFLLVLSKYILRKTAKNTIKIPKPLVTDITCP